jgi:lipopolysaccharide/colanic/teichoic acid biosynthesis glycosyltransferase
MSVELTDYHHYLTPSSPAALDQQCPLSWCWYVWFKTAVEFLAALCLFVLAAPVIAICAVLVRLTSRGPAFYFQTRLGLNGRPYSIFKLRTMYHNCEKASGARWSTAGDARITPLGHFLRRTHLDELPQLINVLRGDMSLVGPRPERPEFVPALEQALPRYRERLRVRPGVTGLAQVQLPADTDVESVRRKLAYDLYYVRFMGPWLDLRILVGTALKVFGLSFEQIRKLVFVPGRDAVEAASQTQPVEEVEALPCPQPELVSLS